MRTLRLIALFGICCFLIGLSYLITRLAVSALWRSSLNPFYAPGIGLDRNSALFLAIPLLTVPYITGGAFLGRFRSSRYALPIGLITTLSERFLILAAAAYVLGQFRQVTETGVVYFVEGDLISSARSKAKRCRILAGSISFWACRLVSLSCISLHAELSGHEVAGLPR